MNILNLKKTGILHSTNPKVLSQTQRNSMIWYFKFMIFIRGRPLRLLLSGVIQPCHASAQTTENQIFSPYKVLQKLFSSYIATVAHD